MDPNREIETGTISVGDAAKRLGIGRPLAYELARRGELPGKYREIGKGRARPTALRRALFPPLVVSPAILCEYVLQLAGSWKNSKHCRGQVIDLTGYAHVAQPVERRIRNA